MPLFEVAVLSVPSAKEIENGAVEQLVVPPTFVVAKDESAAGIALAMKEGVKFDLARSNVLVRPFA